MYNQVRRRRHAGGLLTRQHAFTGPALPKEGYREPGWRPSTQKDKVQLAGWPLYRDYNGMPVDRTIYKGTYDSAWDTRPKRGMQPA